MNDLITTTRATVQRGWTEFEPKVITGLISGSTAAALIPLLSSFGVDLGDAGRNFLIVGCYFLGAYLTPSSGMVITTKSGNGTVETKTTGHTVTTSTNSIPVQAAPIPLQAPDVPLSQLLRNTGATFTPGPFNTDDQATQIIPPNGN